uniref:BOF domain-containing protein n=1 Tax=Caenorhabditis tropicalis TaxID=1561998 RepID=A0A1I7UGT1_9PELO
MKAVLVLLLVFAVLSDASKATQKVKKGARIEIDFQGATVIKRQVAAGTQYYHFDGPNKGSFVDEKGNKIDSSNFEGDNGILTIKKFTEADLGTYNRHPNVFKTPIKGGFTTITGQFLTVEFE